MTVVKRRIGQSAAQHIVHFLVGINNPTGALLEGALHSGEVAEMVIICIAMLHFGEREVD